MKAESDFQKNVIHELKLLFPECIILKNDSSYVQGIPDLLILNQGQWAALEVKRCANATHRPNQDYYVKKMKEMSYAAFIYPENEGEIYNELTDYFQRARTVQS